MKTYSPEIALIRDALQMTHAHFAAACGTTPNWISQVISGSKEPSPLLLCRMAQVTGVPPEDMREAGRHDVAKMLMVTASPSPSLRGVPDRALVDEVARRLAGSNREEN